MPFQKADDLDPTQLEQLEGGPLEEETNLEQWKEDEDNPLFPDLLRSHKGLPPCEDPLRPSDQEADKLLNSKVLLDMPAGFGSLKEGSGDLLNSCITEQLLLDEKQSLKQNLLLTSDLPAMLAEEPKWQEYEQLEVLGEGSYGKIYKVRERNGEKRMLVIKEVDTSELRKDYEALAEINVMAQMNSPYIVKYYDSFITQSKKVNIVMEFCEHGDLHKLLRKRKHLTDESKHRYLSENRVWSFFIQICIGLYHLHSNNILHRDLKTLNIFLTKENKIKIGDLGGAKILENNQDFATSKVGTPYYLSPEVCEDRPYNNKSDIWSLGCILYEMCTLKHPFEAKNTAALLLKIIKGKYESIPRIYSRALGEIVHSCLIKDFKKRPSIKSILLHEVVQSKALLLKLKLPVKKEEKNLAQQLDKNEETKQSDRHSYLNRSLNRSLNRFTDKRTSQQEKLKVTNRKLHSRQESSEVNEVEPNSATGAAAGGTSQTKPEKPTQLNRNLSRRGKLDKVCKSARNSSNSSYEAGYRHSDSAAQVISTKPKWRNGLSRKGQQLKLDQRNLSQGEMTTASKKFDNLSCKEDDKPDRTKQKMVRVNSLYQLQSSKEDLGAAGGAAVQQSTRPQNTRLLKQSKYNEVLRKFRAIPEVGTTEQQMRKQYDERLSENQLKKLLQVRNFVQNVNTSDYSEPRPTTAGSKKDVSPTKRIEKRNKGSEDAAGLDVSQQSSESAGKEAVQKGLFSFQVVSCSNPGQKRVEPKDRKLVKSTTVDSDETNKFGSQATQATGHGSKSGGTTTVLGHASSSSVKDTSSIVFPTTHQPTSRQKRPIKQPKIKPNYTTKAGGMMMRRIRESQLATPRGGLRPQMKKTNSRQAKKDEPASPRKQQAEEKKEELVSIQEGQQETSSKTKSFGKTLKSMKSKNSKSCEKTDKIKTSSNSGKDNKLQTLQMSISSKKRGEEKEGEDVLVPCLPQSPKSDKQKTLVTSKLNKIISHESDSKKQSEVSAVEQQLNMLSKKEFLEDYLITPGNPSEALPQKDKPEAQKLITMKNALHEEDKLDIDGVEEALSMLESFEDKDSLEDPFVYGTESIMKDIMQDELAKRSVSKISFSNRPSIEDSAIALFTKDQGPEEEEAKQAKQPHIMMSSGYKPFVARESLNNSQSQTEMSINMSQDGGDTTSFTAFSQQNPFEKSIKNINHSFYNIKESFDSALASMTDSSVCDKLSTTLAELEQQFEQSSQHCKLVLCKDDERVFTESWQQVYQYLGTNVPQCADISLTDFEVLGEEVRQALEKRTNAQVNIQQLVFSQVQQYYMKQEIVQVSNHLRRLKVANEAAKKP